MVPCVPISLPLLDLKKLLVDANTDFFQPDCCSLPADQTESYPSAWDNFIPKEEADRVRELDANSSSASVSKPEATEKTKKPSCYNLDTDEAVWQMSTGFGSRQTPF